MRARNIKPSTFTNELLAFAAPIHTVIFAGLWCIADRRGVLEDRPKQIHTLINPGRSLSSTKTSLSWLEENGFIVRYVVGNYQLIKILAFAKHQNPHRDEKPSDLPDYGASTVPAQCSAPGHNGNGTVPVPEKPEPIGLIPSSLIPDSGFLIPDPPTPQHRAAPERGGRKFERRPKTADELEAEEQARANG
ncbi:MAG TPA: hypothetical protein VNH18_04105 [Bryobacteraceae bacterium]|nr:hypothetical protein [Bryobacteraceae bacterium]